MGQNKLYTHFTRPKPNFCIHFQPTHSSHKRLSSCNDNSSRALQSGFKGANGKDYAMDKNKTKAVDERNADTR